MIVEGSAFGHSDLISITPYCPIKRAITYKAQRVSGNDGTAMRKAVEVFDKLKTALVEATRLGDQTQMDALRKRLNSQAVSMAAKYPQLEVGGIDSGWPYAKIRTAQGSAGPTPPPTVETVETLSGGIKLTRPGPALNNHQRSIFDDIKRERPDATDSQILDYMRKKGWLQ